jgi:hypothetical protein
LPPTVSVDRLPNVFIDIVLRRAEMDFAENDAVV